MNASSESGVCPTEISTILKYISRNNNQSFQHILIQNCNYTINNDIALFENTKKIFKDVSLKKKMVLVINLFL